ncbi:MAG: ROK family transcriptional regulator [candidate division KSB1 bacterium]|nr:ROK family transcriptional regulator [candidate division KSB1 bacterium]MDZ7319824.1 ROK family transcriptional regulator [candidate division KSB1 bacterium]MDZ7342783.1 ROK family transcriptional regulator [candidate division KSB1 bacterium]
MKTDLSQTELNVLRCVYEAGPISRVKVAQRLNLTRATLTVITKKLKNLKLIFEAGKGTSSEGRGRKEVLLSVNPNAGFVLGVHISITHFTVGMLDLNGKVIEKVSQPFPIDKPAPVVLPTLVAMLHQMMDRYQIQKQKIFGIVVAIPGVIDYKRGLLREITLKGWQGFELRSYFENHFDIKVLLENDVKTYTMGEFYFGIGKHVNNMICLWLGDGIGAGIINNGQLVRGISSSAGEIGFNEFILEQPNNRSLLTAGEVRCWGDLLSVTNIKATIRRGIEEGWKTELRPEAQIADFVAATGRGDPLAIYIFKLLSNVLGSIGLNLIYTFNPEILLLSGPLVYQLPQLASEVRAHLKRGLLQSPIENVEVKTSILGENGLLIGGVALMLEYLFGNSNNHFAES